MKLSIVSDELSDDFQTAVELGSSWGIRYYELRNAWLTRAPKIPREGIRVIKEVIKQYDITITTISPGIFKIPLRSEAMEDHRTTLIRESFDLARELDTERMTIFGIKRSIHDRAEDYHQVIQILGEAAELAQREGFTLLLENEAGWWADTGKNTGRIVEEVGSEALKVNWDPGNAFTAGEEPFPIGYQAVRGKIANVHIKWATRDPNGRTRYLGSDRGYIDLGGQLQALVEDYYRGFVAVETHSKPRISESTRCLDLLRKVGKGLFNLDPDT